MNILIFAFAFIGVGFLIGGFVKSRISGILLILGTTIIWFFIYGPWALATFIELMIGYVVAQVSVRDN